MSDKNYPPIEGNVYSLSRLYASWQKGDLTPAVRVGGRLSRLSTESSWGLTCSHYQLHLPSDISLGDSKAGDLLVVQLAMPDLELDSTQTLRVKKIQSYERVVKSLGAPARAEPQFTFETAQKWADFLFAIREYFRGRGFLEMNTPTLVQNPGMEPELEPFKTEWRRGTKERKALFLPTSPELHLKQLMVQGFNEIFEIKSVFRNEELTEIHEPEFMMIEWYRGFANLDAIANDVCDLLAELHHKGFWAGEPSTLKKSTIAQLFKIGTGFELTPKTTREELLALAQKLKLHPAESFGWNDLFHLIWIAVVEPGLPLGPLLVFDYPPSQAALSRINSRGWADRMELYWNRVEIANAFHELNDPKEQRERFVQDQKKRVEYGRTPLEIDENFLRALEYGLPPSGGIALGLDRLFMVMTGAKDLKSLRAFSIEHQLRGN